jgi:putative aldouronate transport system substrate-binding protein
MRRIVSILLVVTTLMTFVLLTGCGASNNTAAGDQSTASSTSVAASTSVANASSEPVEIKVFAKLTNGSDKYDTFPVIQQCEKEANVKITWEFVDEQAYDEKKNLMLSSGDLPDLIMMKGLTNADILANVSLFLPLEDYINNSCANIKKMFDEEPLTKTMATAPDGHIYSLPSVMPFRPETYDMAFINKVWLDKLSLPVPSTTEEFYTALKAFKTQDPNGNGKKDEVPFTTVHASFSGLFGLTSLMGSFGVVNNFTDDLVMIKESKVTFIPTMDGFKAGVQYLHKLYAEGLIDQEVFTTTWDKITAMVSDPAGNKVGAGLQWTIGNVTGATAEKDYVVLPPLKGSNGDSYWRSNVTQVKYSQNLATVTKSCKNPEAVMNFLNLIYDEENSLQLFYGPIPTCMEKASDGTYTILPPPEGFTAGAWQWKNAFNANGPVYVGKDIEQKTTPPTDIASKMEAEKTYSQNYVKEIFPPIFWDKATTDELSVVKTDISKYVDDRFASWIVKGGIEDEWDTYLKKLDQMGMSKLMEIYVKGYENSRK